MKVQNCDCPHQSFSLCTFNNVKYVFIRLMSCSMFLGHSVRLHLHQCILESHSPSTLYSIKCMIQDHSCSLGMHIFLVVYILTSIFKSVFHTAFVNQSKLKQDLQHFQNGQFLWVGDTQVMWLPGITLTKCIHFKVKTHQCKCHLSLTSNQDIVLLSLLLHLLSLFVIRFG